MESSSQVIEQKKSGVVVIAGRPNAGKSTLINRVLGSQLSIVSPKPQTTREGVRGVYTESEGQIVFVDTPGIHNARDGGINQYMMSQVHLSLEAPDLIWYLVDPRTALHHEQNVLEILKKAKAPVFLILSKQDLKSKVFTDESLTALENELLSKGKELGIQWAQALKISAHEDEGVKELLAKTWSMMPVGPYLYPDGEDLSDRPARFFVGEMIREQLFMQLGEELPYACAVQITKYQEQVKPLRIEATIFVERDSQKGMVIGKAGVKIKAIGTQARIKIEEFLGQKIFLGLKTEVLKNWTRDAAQLKQLGYHLPKRKDGT